MNNNIKYNTMNKMCHSMLFLYSDEDIFAKLG